MFASIVHSHDVSLQLHLRRRKNWKDPLWERLMIKHTSRKIVKNWTYCSLFLWYKLTYRTRQNTQTTHKTTKQKNMVRLIPSYFTEQVILKILNHSKDVNWMEYRKYHSQYEKITSRNAIYIMTEFNNICETIATFPKEYFNIVFVDRLLEKYKWNWNLMKLIIFPLVIQIFFMNTL